MSYKYDFKFGKLIKSAEQNTNFIVLKDWDVFNEHLSSQIDGIKDTFILNYSFVSGSTRLYIDGIRQTLDYDYKEILPNQISMAGVPNGSIPQVGQEMDVDYRRSDLL